MIPRSSSMNLGVLSRDWWQRYQPEAGQTLAASTVAALLTGAGVAVQRVPLENLHLWGTFQLARAAAGLGFSSLGVEWPSDDGMILLAVNDLLRTPGVEAWAAAVSLTLSVSALPAALSGALVCAALLLWRELRRAEPAVVEAANESGHVLVQEAVDAEPIIVEPPLPVILPDLPPPPTTEPIQSMSPLPQDVPKPVVPSGLPTPPSSRAPLPGPLGGKPSVSYEQHWGLSQLPFENVPDPKFYFPAPMHEEALHRLLYGVQTRKGAVMLTGDIGCGKTLLSRELGMHLAGKQYDLALIANPSFGVEDFLTEVLYQLGMEPTKTKVKLLHLLNERLLENYKKGKQTVVVVDEAQAIPDDLVFEELRLLLNFQLNDRFLLTLVLMGQPELNARVMAIKQFAQRISIKYHLGAFPQEETSQYIAFRLKAARCERDIFSKDALALIFQRSGGVPRNINRLCDLCLLIGYMDRAQQVDQAIAERAAADLS